MKKVIRSGSTHILILLTLVLGCARTGAELRAADRPGPGASGASSGVKSVFVNEIQPIFDAKCTSCHGADRSETGLRLDSWEHLIAGSDFGEAVIAFDANHSTLVEMTTALVGGVHPSDVDGARLSESEVGKIRNWIEDGARGPSDQVPFADSNNLIYVTNQGDGSVNVIDSDANVVARRIDLTEFGFETTSKPHHIAVEPDGSYWYVTLIAGNVVLKFTRDNRLVGRADFEVPGLLALDPTSDRLYVGRSMAAVNPPTRIGFIERSSMDIEEVEVFHPRPHALAVDPTGRYVLSGSLGENRIMVIDTRTGDAERYSLEGPVHTLVQFAISPDGSTMIVGGQLTGKLFFFDTTSLPSLPLTKTIDVNPAPWHPVFAPDGRSAYIANKMSNTVSVIDMNRRDVSDVISGTGLSQPHGAALSHDGWYLYISSNNLDGAYSPRHDFGDNALDGTVSVIDTSTLQIVKVLEVGPYAAGAGSRAAQ